MPESVFFCMVRVGVEPNATNEMVCCTGEERPYITKSKNGLLLTRHHSNMFLYTPGNNIARYVDDPRRMGNLFGDVTLRPDQIEALDKAISENYFFD